MSYVERPEDEGIPPHHDPSAANEREWETPVPLASTPPLPAFPCYALSTWLRDWVEAEALFTQTPVDLPAVLALAVLATAAQGAFVLRVKPGYVETLSLFVVVVAAPGERKSPVERAVKEPVNSHERQLNAATEAQRREQRIRRKYLEQRQQRALKAGLEDEALRLQGELDALGTHHPRRYFVDDVTPERLGMAMLEQGGRIAILSAEGGAFAEVVTGKRYAKGNAHIDLLLKGHDGDSVRLERVSREPVCIDRPALTIGVALQPALVPALAEHRGRGLTGRMLFALPGSAVGSRSPDPPPVAGNLVDAYHAGVRRMLSAGESVMDSSGEPHELVLDVDALEDLHAFGAAIEKQLGPDGELDPVADWATKIVGRAARIAALLHLADGTPGKTVSRDAMGRAIAIARYFIAHAAAAYCMMGADPRVEGARRILAVIRRHALERPSARDLHQRTRQSFARKEDFDAALAVLVTHGWVREVPSECRPGPGRPRSPSYEVHPDVFSSVSSNCTKSPCVHF